MNEAALHNLFKTHKDRFRPLADTRLRATAGGTVQWTDVARMLEQFVALNPTEPTHVPVYYATDTDAGTVVEVALKSDPFTAWHWRPNTAADPNAGQAPPGRDQRNYNRQAVPNDQIVTVAAELRLANGPGWHTLPRRIFGNGHIRRRLGISTDQARTRIERADELADTNPEFVDQVEAAAEELRSRLIADGARLMIAESLDFPVAWERLDVGLPFDHIDDLANDTENAVTGLIGEAKQLRQLLGGRIAASTVAYSDWRYDHPDIPYAQVLNDARAQAAAVTAGTTRKAQLHTWLAHYPPAGDQGHAQP